MPVVKVSLTSLLGKRRKRSFGDEDYPFFTEEFDSHFQDLDPSAEFYPQPYCSVVEGDINEPLGPVFLQFSNVLPYAILFLYWY